MRWPALLAVVLACAHGADAASMTLDDLEQAVHEAVRERNALAQERRSRGDEAAALADEISRIKRRESAPRADRELERGLRAFDRLVGALDDLDRRLKAQERTIDHAWKRFEKQADREMARLSEQKGGGASLAARVDSIETAIRRVRQDVARERRVRPALDIVLDPNDGPAEIRVKLALLQAEQRRFADLIVTLDQEIKVVETRLLIKRQLAREVKAASEDAGAGLSLLQRESDDLLQAVKEMERRREALLQDRAHLPRVLLKLDDLVESLLERESVLTTITPEEP
ncbi:MAG: hypothetical protein JXO72_10860 [Vicinamibacteria bacterium]|nr:hypothetical protein [Vicinamibacteria bacterium]